MDKSGDSNSGDYDQQKMLLDYLAIMQNPNPNASSNNNMNNGGPGSSGGGGSSGRSSVTEMDPGPGMSNGMNNPSMHDLILAKQYLDQFSNVGMNGMSDFPNGNASSQGVSNNFGNMAMNPGSSASWMNQYPPPYLQLLNSHFHKEFMRQMNNVQKSQMEAVPPPLPPVTKEKPRLPQPCASDPKRHECEYCHKTFASRYYMSTHVATHCPAAPPSVTEPLKRITSPEQLRLLEKCQQKNQQMQQQNYSSKEGKFTCVKCGRWFYQEQEFKQHMMSHSGERPYNCNLCGKRYRYVGNLETHKCLGKINQDSTTLQIKTENGSMPSLNGRNMNGFYQNAPSSSKYFSTQQQQQESLQNDLKMMMMMENSIQSNGGGSQGMLSPAVASSLVNALSSDRDDTGTKLNCGLCFKSFVNEVELMHHLKTHKPADIDMMMMMMSAAASSMQNDDDEDDDSNNNKMGMNTRQGSKQDNFSQLNGLTDKFMNNGGELMCVVCNKSFKNLMLYYTHIKTHTEMFPQTFVCHICKESFNSEESLEIHKRKVHSKTIIDTPRYSCEEELQLNQQEENDLSTNFSEDWNFKCSTCAAKFREQQVFDYHLLLHKGERPHSCSICAKCFKSRLTLTVHENSHNQKIPPKLLPLNNTTPMMKAEPNGMYALRNGGGGGNDLPIPGSFKAIMRPHLDQTNDISYQCTICDKVYNNKTELKDHELTHSVDGEYTCNVCWKRFRSLIGLKIHKNKHANEMKQQAMTGIPMRVKKEESMVNDIRESELFIEEFNGVDKERPYVCRICNKRFKTKHALPYHMLLHTGETPFTCNFCGKGFRSLISLKLHTKKHEDGTWKMEFNNYDQPTTSAASNANPSSYPASFENTDNLTMKSDAEQNEEEEDEDNDIESGHEDENEPNINDFCAVEMMMEPEITINEDESEEKHQSPMNMASVANGLNGQYSHFMNEDDEIPDHHEDNVEQEHRKPIEKYPDIKPVLNSNSDLKYECPICFKRFKNRLSLPYHLMTHERGEPFGCNHCNRKFVSQMKLKRHMKMKHFMEMGNGQENGDMKMEDNDFQPVPLRVGKFKFNCSICNRKFKTKFSLRIHQKHHHLFKFKRGPKKNDENGENGEGVPNQEGADKEGNNSADDDEEDVLFCKICNKHFTTMAGKEYHMMIHNNIKPYECDQCGKKFRSYSYFKIHTKYHLTNRVIRKGRPRMFGDFNMNNSYQLSKEYEHLKTEDGSYACNICQKKFKCRQSLPYHMNLHNKNSIFRCMICNLGFRNLRRLKSHNATQHGDRDIDEMHPNIPMNGMDLPLKQEMIIEDELPDRDLGDPMSVNDPIQLSDHSSNTSMTLNVDPLLIPQVHMGGIQVKKDLMPVVPPPVVMPQEEEVSRPSFVPEMQLIELESGEKAYLCLLCKKMCRSKQASVYHRMIHTGEKPYKCEICDKRCRSQANLELHKKMHKNEQMATAAGNSYAPMPPVPGVPPPMIRKRNRFRINSNSANIMPFENFPTDSRMDMSMNRWRAFADFKRIRCVECNYKFKSVQALTYHCMIHTGEKPYQCKICRNSFRSKTNLTLHERSHFPKNGEEVYAPSFNPDELQVNYNLQLDILNGAPGLSHQMMDDSMPPQQKSPANCYCIVCEKSFRTEGYVRHHQLLTHQVRSDVNVNELPTIVNSADGYIFKCERCGNCFRTKQYYYYHLNTHHGGEQLD